MTTILWLLALSLLLLARFWLLQWRAARRAARYRSELRAKAVDPEAFSRQVDALMEMDRLSDCIAEGLGPIIQERKPDLTLVPLAALDPSAQRAINEVLGKRGHRR